MKKEYRFLIASICFLVASIASFLSDMEDKVVFMGVFAALGIAFMAMFQNYKRKNNGK